MNNGKCKACGSERILNVTGKCSDLFFATDADGREYRGYVPRNLEIGGSDYVEFSYCLDCGKIQGDFPVGKKDVDKVFAK